MDTDVLDLNIRTKILERFKDDSILKFIVVFFIRVYDEWEYIITLCCV